MNKKETVLKVDVDRIKYKLKHLNSKGECTKITNEEKRSWLINCKTYKEVKPVCGFRNFKDKNESEYLIYEDDIKNYTVTVYGTIKWISVWKDEIKCISDFIKGNNRDLIKFSNDWDRSFEIIKDFEPNSGGLYTNEELILKHKGCYMFIFDYGWSTLFSNKEFKEHMEKRSIHNVDYYGTTKLVMFKKVFTKKTLLKSIKQYNELYKILKSFNEKIIKVENKFFKSGVWKKYKI